MKNIKRFWFVPVVILVIAGIYIACSYNLKSHNFGVVEEGKLYRSAEPSEIFLKELISKYQIKTIVVLSRRVRENEKKLAKEHGMIIYHLPLKAGKEPPEDAVRKFLEIAANAEHYPILVHCRAGADRTGLLVAIKRIELDGWSLNKAQNEMKYYRHIPFFQPTPTRYLRKRYEQ